MTDFLTDFERLAEKGHERAKPVSEWITLALLCIGMVAVVLWLLPMAILGLAIELMEVRK